MLPHVEKNKPPRVRLLLQDATLFEMWFRVQLARWNCGDLRTCELQPQPLRSDVTPLHHFWHATNQQPRTCDPDWSSTWEHPNRDLQETVQLVGETGSFFSTEDENVVFRKNSMLNRTASRQAHLRSHSGRNAGVVFSHAPTIVEFTVPPHLFRVLLLERSNFHCP